ncbi:hypothetical protein CK203_086560 [Vitis vinifera]|uniref:SUI1 domain-containing protein n=1 Tax=Vitis vinifera TaxID=29760 RepID=A0A438FKT7_VITVI|nr:hypothetical protein CK203_086560 [Vitis vinifera]
MWYHQKGRRTLPKARAGIGVEKKWSELRRKTVWRADGDKNPQKRYVQGSDGRTREVGRLIGVRRSCRRRRVAGKALTRPHAPAREIQPPAGKLRVAGAWLLFWCWCLHKSWRSSPGAPSGMVGVGKIGRRKFRRKVRRKISPENLPSGLRNGKWKKVIRPVTMLLVKVDHIKHLKWLRYTNRGVHVNPIFASVGVDTGKLFSASEATDIVFRYIEKENLVKPTDKSMVVLDAILCDALFKGAIKKGSTYPTAIHKKELGHTFVNRMQAHHVVTRGGESVVRKALASELQKKFACSTTVAELPGKKGHEVLVQGGVIEDLAKHLVEQYGIPKRCIEVLDKTKK